MHPSINRIGSLETLPEKACGSPFRISGNRNRPMSYGGKRDHAWLSTRSRGSQAPSRTCFDRLKNWHVTARSSLSMTGHPIYSIDKVKGFMTKRSFLTMVSHLKPKCIGGSVWRGVSESKSEAVVLIRATERSTRRRYSVTCPDETGGYCDPLCF